MRPFRESTTALLAARKAGAEWDVVVVEAGWSKNVGPYGQRYYPADTLKAAVPLFDGVPVCLYKYEAAGRQWYDHLPLELRRRIPAGAAVGNVVGWLARPRYGTFTRPNGERGEGILARLRIAESARWLRQLLRDAWEHGKKELFGLSLDTRGDARAGIIDGRAAEIVTKLAKPNSVDLVTVPAAGGGLLRLVASATSADTVQEVRTMATAKEVLEALKRLGDEWLEGFDVSLEQEDEDLRDALTQILEANRERAKNVIDEAGEERELIEAVASGLSVINKLINLIKEKNYDAALKVLQAWAASAEELRKKYPSPYAYPYPPPYSAQRASQGTEELKAELEELKGKVEALKARLPKSESESESVKTEADSATESQNGNEGGEKPVDEEIKKLKQELTATLDELREAAEAAKAQKEAIEKERVELRKAAIQRRLRESGLPEKFMEAAREEVGDKLLSDEELDKIIERYTKLAESAQESAAQPVVLGQGARIQFGDDPLDKIKKGLDLALDPSLASREEYKNVTPVGLRESYMLFHGLTTMPAWPDGQVYRENLPYWLRETITTASWTRVFGDSITRKLQRDWAAPGFQWQRIATATNVSDFRTQRRVRVYDFANLSEVPEGSDYPDLADPSDIEATYTPSKRGGIFSVTWEAILNDDLNAISRRVRSLGRAMNRTLEQSVFDALLAYTSAINDTAWSGDNAALYSAARGNLGSDALSYSALLTAIQAMNNQADDDSGEKLGIKPHVLVVPIELEGVAIQILGAQLYPATANAATAANAVRRYLKEDNLLVSNYLRGDANNWYLVANPAIWDTIEVGFVGGQREPVLETQEQATVGTVFTADKIRYRIKMAWGVGVLSPKTLYASIVA